MQPSPGSLAALLGALREVDARFADAIEATGGTAGNLVTLDPRSVNEFYEERGVKGA